MRYANQIKSRFLMVVGDNEIESKKIELKKLSTGENIKIKLDTEEIFLKVRSNG
jgi:histidyl-tRNA synthetase